MNPLLRTAAEKGPAGGASLSDTTACFVMGLLLDVPECETRIEECEHLIASMRSDFIVALPPSSRHGADRVCASGLPGRLERSGDWIEQAPPARGIARLRAGLKSQPYSRHRHDTYSISVTRSG